MNLSARELRSERKKVLDQAREMISVAEKQNRDFTSLEESLWSELMARANRMEDQIGRLEMIPGDLLRNNNRNGAPANLRYGLGDDETRALAHYFRSGDRGAISGIGSSDEGEFAAAIQLPRIQIRAVDEIMNVTTAADGGAAVPTGFSGQIAARMGEISIAERLGCRMVPGRGTTVNFPYENADPNMFATTSEQVDNLSNTYERDRPTLATKAFTLVKKTKKLELTEELLDDEDANLMSFVADHIGRAVSLTMNSMLLTEAAASGTSVSIGTTSAIAAGDPEKLAYHATLSYYLDDGGSIGWVMRPATFGAIKVITGDSRMYENQSLRSERNTLLEYPVIFSNSAAAVGSGAISCYFGNWYGMGYRLDPSLRLIRDPYTTDGVINLKYSFRACFGVLVAGAIGYGKHPTT